MACQDLREFVSAREKNDELKRIPFEVDPRLEITEFADRAVKQGGPALLFERPTGYQVPVLVNAFSLLDYPVLQCWPEDGGRFITLPLVFSRNPDTGKRNCGMYRMQVYDERTAGMHWQTHKQGAEHYRRMQQQGRKRMDVAVGIGADPATMYSAILPLPPDLDEMMIAGFLRQSPVEMVDRKSTRLNS